MTAGDPFDLLRAHIDKQFESIHLRINDVRTELRADITEVKHVLDGNGQPGLVRLVDRHEQRFNSMDTDTRKTAKDSGAKWGGLVSAVVSGLAMAVAALLGLPKQP